MGRCLFVLVLVLEGASPGRRTGFMGPMRLMSYGNPNRNVGGVVM
jgi:hypothetical protein